MKIEIILALVLISVFVIDYLLRKKKKPQKPYMEPHGLQEAVAEVMDYILINNS